MGACSTQCAVSTDNGGGDVGSHLGNCIIARTMDDRGVIGTGLSTVIYAHVQGLGGSLVLLLFVFVDVREMVPYHCLRVP